MKEFVGPHVAPGPPCAPLWSGGLNVAVLALLLLSVAPPAFRAEPV